MSTTEKGRDAYRDAGVDIEAGDEVVDRIRSHVRSTYRPGVIGDIGGFGGLFSLMGRFKDPILVSGTDGVGTKLLLAQALQQHTTIGIDLVAMCVNDVAVCGAEPLFFLDYFATGKLSPAEAEAVVSGIADGCRQAGCALIGGETAEMPGMYGPGHYDLAGFCVGAVERDAIRDGRSLQPGDALIGLASTGFHSNGYSLVRKIFAPYDLASDPFSLGEPLGETLLRPTKIYVRQLLALRDDPSVTLKAAVHVTGGGFTGNLPRVLPEGLGVEVEEGSWPEPKIFQVAAELAGLNAEERYRTFNNGIGMVVFVPAEQASAVCAATGGWVIGRVVEDPKQEAAIFAQVGGARTRIA